MEFRIVSSFLCANLFTNFFTHLIEVTKKFLQIVLFYTLYLHEHMRICVSISLTMLIGGQRIFDKMLT